MNLDGVIALSRWQFAITTVYHFLFVPLTLGLSIFVAIIESRYVRTGDEKYKKMAKYWGTLFLINFALGVATGIVQEFQFGLNWAGYSRFMGDIFGAPLAIEALLAFYLESTLLGVWIFGWEKLSKKLHAAVMWLVAIGSNLSAIWILIANSFMQEPVGYKMAADNSRVLMENFGKLITNPNFLYQWPHVFFSALTTAGFFVLGISAYHLLRKKDSDIFRTSFRMSAIYGFIGIVFVIIIGHYQGQFLVKHQPMKMAAAEAAWETTSDFTLFAIPNTKDSTNSAEIKIPGMLGFLSYDKWGKPVKGIKELREEYLQKYGEKFKDLEAKYGKIDYVPPVGITYWSFRIMVYAGLIMLLVGFLALFKKFMEKKWFLKLAFWTLFLPFIATSFGWLMAEIGRQPFIVYGLFPVRAAVSPNLHTSDVWFSLITMGLLYAILIVVEVGLMIKYAKKTPEEENVQPNAELA